MLKLLSRDAEIIGFKNISRTIGMLGKIKLSDNVKNEVSKVKESLDIILTYVHNSKKINFQKIKGVTVKGISSKTVDLILDQVNSELIKEKEIDLDYLLLTKVGEQSEFLGDKVIEHSDRLLEENDVIKVLEEVSQWYNEDKMKKTDGNRKRLPGDFKKILESKKEIDSIISKVTVLEEFVTRVNDYRKQLFDMNEARIKQEKIHEERVHKIEESSKKIEEVKEEVENKLKVEGILEKKEVTEEKREFYSTNINKITDFFEKCNREKTGELFINFITNHFDNANNTLKLGLIFLLKEKGLSKESLKDFFKKVDLIKLKDSDLKKWDILDKYIYDRKTVTEDKSHFKKIENEVFEVKKVKKTITEENNSTNNGGITIKSQGDLSIIDTDVEKYEESSKKDEQDKKGKNNKGITVVKKQGDLSILDGENTIIEKAIKIEEEKTEIDIDDMKSKLSGMSSVAVKSSKDSVSIENEITKEEVIITEARIESINNGEVVISDEIKLDSSKKIEAELLIEEKKNKKFRYNEEKFKLMLEYVNAEDLKDFYLIDRKNFGTSSKHYNYFGYYCNAFVRLEEHLDPIFWQKSIDNLGKHLDRTYHLSGDFNPRVRAMVKRLREERTIRLEEEAKENEVKIIEIEKNVNNEEIIESKVEVVELNKIEERSMIVSEVIESEKKHKVTNSDIHSGNDIINEVGSSVVFVIPKSGKTSRGKLKVYGPIKSKGIILKGDERKHIEYKMMIEVNTMYFSRDRAFSKKLEQYIIDNAEDNIFIYELINRLSSYGSLDIITAFVKELYGLNLEDEFYATLYENINNNEAFEKEEINKIEGFKKYGEELRKLKIKEVNKSRNIKSFKDKGMQFYSKGEIQIDTEGYDEYSTGFDVDEYKKGRTIFSDLFDDIKNEDPKTMNQLYKASKEVEEEELKLDERYMNRGLDIQFDIILETKDIKKLYAFIVLYGIIDKKVERKINELLLFSLTKKEIKNNSKNIKKILKILNK